MMGPPPEGGANMGASREDVMNKEGGAGFFFYPPGDGDTGSSSTDSDMNSGST